MSREISGSRSLLFEDSSLTHALYAYGGTLIPAANGNSIDPILRPKFTTFSDALMARGMSGGGYSATCIDVN